MSPEPHYFDLAGDVLDHPVVDVDDFPCGMVDDIEIEGEPGEPLRVKALLVGPGAWVTRLPQWLRRATRKLVGDELVNVPWEQVQQVGTKVKLRLTASALGLGKADRNAERLMERLIGR